MQRRLESLGGRPFKFEKQLGVASYLPSMPEYLTMKIRVRVSLLTGSGQARRRRRRRDFAPTAERCFLPGTHTQGAKDPGSVFFITGFGFVSCPDFFLI